MELRANCVYIYTIAFSLASHSRKKNHMIPESCHLGLWAFHSHDLSYNFSSSFYKFPHNRMYLKNLINSFTHSTNVSAFHRACPIWGYLEYKDERDSVCI